jgi:hypothetical protein
MFKISRFHQPLHFIIQLHQHRYPNDQTQVGFINTLLLNIFLTWFTPFLEHHSPLLNNFESFVEEFSASFGDLNKECTSTNKLQDLHQGSCPTFV